MTSYNVIYHNYMLLDED